MTTYIAGPMTGYPAFNYPEFAYVAQVLRSWGVDVVNPAELDGGSSGKPWDWYMRRALKALADCDEILMLKGWEASRGARLERHVAEQLGMTVSEWAGSSG